MISEFVGQELISIFPLTIKGVTSKGFVFVGYCNMTPLRPCKDLIQIRSLYHFIESFKEPLLFNLRFTSFKISLMLVLTL